MAMLTPVTYKFITCGQKHVRETLWQPRMMKKNDFHVTLHGEGDSLGGKQKDWT